MARKLVLFGACLLQAWATAHAATIYSTFGADPSARGEFPSRYLVGSHYFPESGDTSSGTSYASPFSFSGSAYQLTSITLEIGLDLYEGSLGPNLQIGISYDNGGVPGSPFAVIEPTSPFVPADFVRHLTTFNFSGQTILNPDTTYWLTIGPRVIGVSTEDYNGWYSISTSPSPDGPMARRDFYGGAWNDWAVYPNSRQPLFELNGITTVPEPSTWALLALGGGTFWCFSRSRRR